MFLNIEEPLLVAHSAFSRKEKGVACKTSWHFLFTWLVCYLSRRTFFLSQKNTEEQNTQMHTETLSQPITQNLTATEASPPAPLRMERGVITEIPLYVIHAFSVSSPFLSRPIGVTTHTTPLSNRRGAGGEASVNSVCRRPSVGSKRWWKSSVKSVWSVREKKCPSWEKNLLRLTQAGQ